MRQIIFSLIWVAVAAMPTLNAQQASPNQTTTTQQTSKPKLTGMRLLPQPGAQPTQATIANNNPRRDRRIANHPGNGKPAVNHPGNVKPVDNNPGNGNTIATNGGYGNNKIGRESCREREKKPG